MNRSNFLWEYRSDVKRAGPPTYVPFFELTRLTGFQSVFGIPTQAALNNIRRGSVEGGVSLFTVILFWLISTMSLKKQKTSKTSLTPYMWHTLNAIPETVVYTFMCLFFLSLVKMCPTP